MSNFEKESGVCDEQEPFLSNSKHSKSRSHLIYFLTLALTLSVLVNIFLALPSDLDNICHKHTTLYESPITNEIPIKYKTIQFNGQFFNQSIYRQPPSEEVDSAWLALGVNARHYVLSEKDPEPFGIDPHSLKIIPEQGGGFPVEFEFEHHLHCLNVLRKTTWFNYPHYLAKGGGIFYDDESIVKLHVTHCLDILRQTIQCKPNTQVYGQYWIKDINKPFVDFNTRHKCVDFEALRDWVDQHQTQKELLVDPRDGDVILDTTP